MKIRIFISIFVVLAVTVFGGYYFYKKYYVYSPDRTPINPSNIAGVPTMNNDAPENLTIEVPVKKTLQNNYHIFQTFNNCGPASLSMALSYYGISKSQKELGDALRPYQITSGDNDDKSTTLAELGEKSKEFGLIPYHRPGGNPEIIKKFIAINIPVITRTWTKPTEDIGHYRVIKGYDDDARVFIQDDSLQGKNIKYEYSDFNLIWEKFSNEFLVMVPKEKEKEASQILGELIDEKVAWQKALEAAEEKLISNPQDANQRLNLSVALYHTGDLERSVKEFEKGESGLPMRALWYQIEPIKAYYELGNYDRVFQITNKILENGNRAYSEAYIIRGDVYKAEGKINEAKFEYEKAVLYNKNLREASERLAELS